jgi:chemotaxis protein methyltransferase CheR
MTAFGLPGPTMSPEEFRLLREVIQAHCGLFFRDDVRYLLERRLAPRLEVLGLQTFAEYHRHLRHDPARRAELEAAAEVLTTNETYLHREPNQLRAFSEEILPAVAEENAGIRRLRIWSAGCSTGEEAYTIAILLLRSGLFDGWDLEVFGSDISRRVLAVARTGAYGPSAFRLPESAALRPWFRPEGGKWVVRDEVRRLVGFGHLNLLDGAMLGVVGAMDVVFCRNVLIYFDLPERRRVLEAFRQKLRPGGFLLLGHSESLLHVTADFELVHFRHDLVYRRPRATP